MDFKNKYVLVTGGSSGIGKACVDSFAERGAEHIYVLDVQEPTKYENADWGLDSDDAIQYISCDLSNEQQILEAVSKIDKLDVLVNCAGIHPPERKIEDYGSDEFKKTFDINLVPMFTLCKHLREHLAKSGGAVVNLSSMVGIHGQPAAIDYCASKAAINGFTKGLAIDWADSNIRVNAIAPSNVSTPSMMKWASSFDDPDQALKNAEAPQKPARLIAAYEIANVCLFLASDMSSCLTGQIICANGGSSLGYN